MTTAVQRKVTIDKHGKPVISNLRVPFQRGDVVWVQTSADTVVVTVEKPEEEPLSDDEVSEATALLEKLQGMDLVMEGGAYRFVPKVLP